MVFLIGIIRETFYCLYFFDGERRGETLRGAY